MIQLKLQVLCAVQGMLINWQKSYGLSLVTSDRFHANIGIVTNICNGVMNSDYYIFVCESKPISY